MTEEEGKGNSGKDPGTLKRIKLVVSYEGTNYCGWQVQPNGITIEEVLNRTLSELLGEQIQVIGASRTDAGVHSLGNVAAFDTESRIPPEKICYALNQRLPEDIVVQSSCQVPGNFHPRRCYSEKTYEYRILNRKIPIPTLRRDTYFYYRNLDLLKMQRAAAYLEGEHDFKSFCSVRTSVEDTVRKILSCTVEREAQDKIIIRVTGTGFLYNMVRIIAGTLISVGAGERTPESIGEILEKRDRSQAGPTAPAHGLTMIGIQYRDSDILFL
ncbi:MAG: tRNA pseudouridine(38-40) synthase TruA [Lachnospiraceae bacterium]|nr:tRNA pseudouridine(38-40) synthase TruA [Lachnospiraceae bacterium]